MKPNWVAENEHVPFPFIRIRHVIERYPISQENHHSQQQPRQQHDLPSTTRLLTVPSSPPYTKSVAWQCCDVSWSDSSRNKLVMPSSG
ncbi:hypothetical protein GQ602_005369 [Ophiocordyceps camponoti-floridani]|uniref:Uncharacterized protein n=1 Tax=Ophiocordyceps camponoti-floridani TaxID=2030778 RepID=A0A8H4VCX9_9HYPO|nr:hypothetical protein GQ602_005369 [Ophiocordyceps camponoti-floridani]